MDDPAPIRAALVELAAGWGVERPLETAQIFSCWEEVVGSELASRCRPTSLRGGVLRVRMESAIWASEIRYLGEEIVGRINRAVGTNVVSELKPWVTTRRDEATPKAKGRGLEQAPHPGAQTGARTEAGAAVGRDIEDEALARALKRAFKAAQNTRR